MLGAALGTILLAEVATTDALPGRNSNRLSVGGAAALAASYPGSIEDPGPALVLAKPFWLGKRHRAIQWVFDAALLGSYGANSGHVRLSVGPRYGFDLLLGRVYGMEFRLGAAAALQAGARTAPGIEMFTFSWAHSFRVANDDDRRVKILTFMNTGFWLARDPDNDLGMNAPIMGIGLAYELPY